MILDIFKCRLRPRMPCPVMQENLDDSELCFGTSIWLDGLLRPHQDFELVQSVYADRPIVNFSNERFIVNIRAEVPGAIVEFPLFASFKLYCHRTNVDFVHRHD